MEVTQETLELIEQLAYTAGIVDGEGSIFIAKHKSPRCKLGYTLDMKVSVVNTDEWLTLWLESQYGGRSYPKKLIDGNKPAFEWIISGSHALDFLEEIVPYLCLKKHQAEIAISFQKKKHWGGRTLDNEAEMAIQEAERILLCSLNKRGE